MFRAGLYARVSTHDQRTLSLQTRAMQEYARKRGWLIAMQVKEVGSGAAERKQREKLLEAARRREIDVVLVWRLDRWGRSMADLLATLQELEHLRVGFVSITEALDLTTPAGRAMAALLAVFAEFEREILRERVRAGLAHARQQGKRLGRPRTVAVHAERVWKLFRAGMSKAEIARRLQLARTSVRRILLAPLHQPPASEVHIKKLEKTMASNPDSDLDKLIRKAIRNKQLIRLVYQNKVRVIEPHDYGIHKSVVKLLAYQVRGSSTGRLPGWRWLEVGGISDAQLMDETFPGNRPPPSGQHHQWDEIFIRVAPPEKPSK